MQDPNSIQENLNEKSGDMKKTWELINSIRGKGKRQIKPQFIIGNGKITKSKSNC